MNDKLKAEFLAAKSDMLERMVVAGWLLRTASTKERAVCQPTREGHAIIKALREFVFLKGKPLTPLEFSAFCDIIRTMQSLE
jgi:hypothetical protein